jgi:hypothetical protein
MRNKRKKTITIPLEYYQALENIASAMNILREEGTLEYEYLGFPTRMHEAFSVLQKHQPEGDTYEGSG